MLNNVSSDSNQQMSTLLSSSCVIDLSLLGFQEQQKLITWNDTLFEYHSNSHIHQLVEAQVEKTPQQIALVFKAQELTYEQLNQRANRLAHHLKSLGVGPEALVGICLERSVDMIVALLAILKAGAGYLPLDISYPIDRLQYMVENAQTSILLTQSSLVTYLPVEGRTVIRLDALDVEHYPITNPWTACTLDPLGYVIYTSGSTGKPKGVAMAQQALVNLLCWQRQQSVSLKPGARTLQFTPISFDVSFQEIFSTLIAGGTLVLIDDERRRNPISLLRYLKDTKIQRLFLPFVALSQLAEVAQGEAIVPEHLREVITAGEQLRITPELIQWFKTMPRCRLHNHYGPSESHVVTAFTLNDVPEKWPLLPAIGKPIDNTQIYLLNKKLQAVPLGETGELYIAGDCLARGYLHRPDITAERFIKHGDIILYKTGDLARYLPDGNIEYLGRSDQQIKIRGFRVEPGEIETSLEQYEMVQKAVVIARESETGQKRLVAYVVADGSTHDGWVEQLNEFITAQLPDYMVPSAYMVLETFPLTPSGKVDRRQLPDPVWLRSQTTHYIAPRTPLEIEIKTLWTELLGIEDIGIHDTFCSLGGHSLMAVQLIYRIKEQLGVELNLAKFLGESTIAALAEGVTQIRAQGQLNNSEDAIADKATLDDTIQVPILPDDPIPNYFLTGATGFLGAYLLHSLLRYTRGDIYCLVRATSIPRGFTRLKNTLKRYQLWHENDADRIIPIKGDLSMPRLGIREFIFNRLAKKLDAIYHCGSWVNVLYPYSALEASNVGGTQEILRLASQSRVKPVHYISTVDVFATAGTVRTVEETGENSPIGPVRSLFSGYAKSKYVAETLMQEAHHRGIPMIIYRPSNIMGDTASGICSSDSFVVKMIQGCIQMGIAPDIDAALNLVPVDYVSRTILHLSQIQSPNGQAFNVVNPHSYSWNDLVDWVRDKQGYPLKRVAYETWCSEVIDAINQDQDHPLFFLTTFFTNLPFIQKSLGAFHFQCDQLREALQDSSISCAAVGDELLGLYFDAFVKRKLIPAVPEAIEQAFPLSLIANVGSQKQ